MFETKEDFYLRADELVNLTGKMFSIYDDATGDILHFPSFTPRLRFEKALEIYQNRPKALTSTKTFYVFTEDMAKRLEAAGANPNDIALRTKPSKGRRGDIVHLHWAKDHTKKIVLPDYHGENGIKAKQQ